MDTLLNKIGFTDFVHLDRNKRDGKKRKIYSKPQSNGWITILIRKEQKSWELEKLTLEGDTYNSYFKVNNLKELLELLFLSKEDMNPSSR